MLQQEHGDDYVLATGVTRRVRDFAGWVFEALDMPLDWRGKGIDEKGYCQKTGKVLIEVDARYFRPTEVDLLQGSSTRRSQ